MDNRMPVKLQGTLAGIFICSGYNSFITVRKEIVRVLDNGLEGDKHTRWFRGADSFATENKDIYS